MTATRRPRDRARPDGHGRKGVRHHDITRQVRHGNEGPRARYPRPDALLTTEGLALGEHRIRTGDGPEHGTHSHLPPPPPERVEGQNSTYSRCTVKDISSTPYDQGASGGPWVIEYPVAPAGGVVEQDQATGEEPTGLEDDIRPDSLFSRFLRPARTRWPAPSSPGPRPRPPRSHNMCLDGKCHSFIVNVIVQCLMNIIKKCLGHVRSYLSDQSR